MASGDTNIAVRYKTEAPGATGRIVIADELTKVLRNRVNRAKARDDEIAAMKPLRRRSQRPGARVWLISKPFQPSNHHPFELLG